MFFALSILVLRADGADSTTKPIRALLIAGGCCHDYARQQEALCKGISARANVQVDVYWTDNSTTTPVLPLYGRLNWAEGYDVIIHDECAADIKDPAILNRIIATHKKIPAVHLHCAMHSFRTGSDAWFNHLGLQSSGHGPQQPIAIQFTDTNHPITQGLQNWTTINEELYNNVKLFGAHPIAKGLQKVGDRTDEAVVAWTNETAGARSFSTTIGHNTETVADGRYLDLVSRGLLWACDKLSAEYLVPYQGDHAVTFIDKNKFSAPTAALKTNAPADATLVKITASSTQPGNETRNAIDGDNATRWCAEDGSFPQTLSLEFETPQHINNIQLEWEISESKYEYQIEGSEDSIKWVPLPEAGSAESQPFKFIRIVINGSSRGWASIRQWKIKGKTIGTLWPADPKNPAAKFVPLGSNALSKQGNTVPRIEKLSAEAEAEILKDVKVADGFEATVFAAPPAVNYPVFVAADVDGTLYVSSDGNGSLGRNPNRGRVIRLKDTDGDGRADQTNVFCEVDAPRGLVWDHDRLYLMHPPNLSVFFDHDGDGVADEQKTLVKNLAFGYDKRPADHTTNGVSLGADGWLYIAGGDFGFMDAEGTDGRKVTHRGGGVIRVRPDGTGLEVYSTGTRNILEVAISPALEMFARDNTNDGGGWDVRLHHFTGMDDHGYPRLYKNFNDECVQPLADYGGGSGCGAVYIDEPGFGQWNDAPFTADWGTGSLYRHTVNAEGATYNESSPPQSFIKMTRPTDADVDGNSRVYCASWRGATFDWNGENVGYIVCVKPKNFVPTPLLDVAKASDQQLSEEMESPSNRRRVAASRELLRRGNPSHSQVLSRFQDSRTPERKLLEHLQQENSAAQSRIEALRSTNPVVVHTAIRTLAAKREVRECFAALDSGHPNLKALLRALAMVHEPTVVDGLIDRLSQTPSQEMRRELLTALCRLHFIEGVWKGDSWGTRPDTRGPYYQPEPWSETDRIAITLRQILDRSNSEEAAFLIETMHRNRIEQNDVLDRMLKLAETSDSILPAVMAQIRDKSGISSDAISLAIRIAERKDLPANLLADSVVCLSKVSSAEAMKASMQAMVTIDAMAGNSEDRKRAKNAFVNAPGIDSQVGVFADVSRSGPKDLATWADVALLAIASKQDTSPEALSLSKQTIEQTWTSIGGRKRLIESVFLSESRFLDDEILKAQTDSDESIAKRAKEIVQRFKIVPKVVDSTPKIKDVGYESAKASVVSMKGDLSIGMQMFQKANCVSCHTVRQDEVQKGPYLGNITKTYKRPEMIDAILEPSKTIAQGFTTNTILTVDGVVLTGFVTNESSDRVTIRDQQGKESSVMKDDIEERNTSPVSVMPTGVMNEFTTFELASLLDYLESLAK